MSVRENLDLGAFLRRDETSPTTSTACSSCSRGCTERERQNAGTMSGGEQQMLAIGRALMANPTLLMLDEPSMGLAPILVDRIYETVAEINRQGTTILLVEQNANYALEVSKRGYVLETGRSCSPTTRRRCARTPKSRTRTWEHDPFALLGAKALYLLYAWLASAIAASYLSHRKGYGEQPGPRVRPAAQRGGRHRLALLAGARALAWKRSGPFGSGGASQPFGRSGSRQGGGTGTLASERPPSPTRGVTLHQTSVERW